jgi:hypothetical protein
MLIFDYIVTTLPHQSGFRTVQSLGSGRVARHLLQLHGNRPLLILLRAPSEQRHERLVLQDQERGQREERGNSNGGWKEVDGHNREKGNTEHTDHGFVKSVTKKTKKWL